MTLLTALIPITQRRPGNLAWYAGTINLSGEQVVVVGWLAANGAAVSRATYAQLFAKIGTKYGAGDGSTTFNLPNHTDGKNPISRGGTNYQTTGATGGERLHTLTAAEEPQHSHTYVDRLGPRSGSGSFGQLQRNPEDYGGDRTDTSEIPTGHSGGAAAGHQNMPPVRVVGGIIIKY